MANDSTAVMRSKFRGCLLGSHVGDCLGGPLEFRKVSQPVISRLLKDSASEENGGEMPYTDDTEMTLSLAKSLVEHKKIDLVDISKRFVDEYFKYQDRNYGCHVGIVFSLLAKNNFNDVVGPAKSQFDGSGSYGNGAAMRVAPIALYSFNDDKSAAFKAVEVTSCITHTHEDGVNGAILQHLAQMIALKTNSSTSINKEDFVDSLLAEMEALESTSANPNTRDKKPYCTALKYMKDIFESGKYHTVAPSEIAKTLGNDEIAVASVPSAIYCFLRGLEPLDICESDNPFIRSVHYALSLGGDTDTIAAMAGSISGAYFGEEIIPVNIMKKCEAIQESIDLADKLYELSNSTKRDS